MAARAKRLTESEQLRLWLDVEVASRGLTTQQLEAWRPDGEAPRQAGKARVAEPTKRVKRAPETALAANYEWPGCDRYTYRGEGTKGRCWVCTPGAGEELCAWCAQSAADVVEQDRLAAIDQLTDRAAIAARPYSQRWAASDHGSQLVAAHGSASAAIAAIVAGAGTNEFSGADGEEWLPHLIAWDMPDGEASARWLDILERSRQLYSHEMAL